MRELLQSLAIVTEGMFSRIMGLDGGYREMFHEEVRMTILMSVAASMYERYPPHVPCTQ